MIFVWHQISVCFDGLFLFQSIHDFHHDAKLNQSADCTDSMQIDELALLMENMTKEADSEARAELTKLEHDDEVKRYLEELKKKNSEQKKETNGDSASDYDDDDVVASQIISSVSTVSYIIRLNFIFIFYRVFYYFLNILINYVFVLYVYDYIFFIFYEYFICLCCIIFRCMFVWALLMLSFDLGDQ